MTGDLSTTDTPADAYEWFRDYATHRDDCEASKRYAGRCTCGLFAALARLRQDSSVEDEAGSSAAGEDGAAHSRGHHEPVGERQGRQPASSSAAVALLTTMLDPTWWREEVNVNGEYTTTRARDYYDVIGDIRAALEETSAAGTELRDAHKIAAYDAARATVKVEGNTRAYYVLRAEAAEAQAAELRDALRAIAELDESEWPVTYGWKAVAHIQELARRALAAADADTPKAAVNYTGPEPSVECAYEPCRNRLLLKEGWGPQWCSEEHRALASVSSGANTTETGDE